MTPLRLVQNFRGLRAMVALPSVPEPLHSGLLRLGLTVDCLGDRLADDVPALCAERDVLLLDGDAGVPPALLAAGVPVIGMVGIETPGRMRTLMQAGATAFLRKPVAGGAVYAALYLGINAYRQREAAEARLADHERRRRGRRHVVKAVLARMQRDGIDDDDAYEALRREAMRARAGIEDFCAAWLQDAAEAELVSQERKHA